MELLHIGVVAKRIAPPSGKEIHAISFHVAEELTATTCGSGKLVRFIGGGGRRVLLRLVGRLGDSGDGAEIRTSGENKAFIRWRRG